MDPGRVAGPTVTNPASRVVAGPLSSGSSNSPEDRNLAVRGLSKAVGARPEKCAHVAAPPNDDSTVLGGNHRPSVGKAYHELVFSDPQGATARWELPAENSNVDNTVQRTRPGSHVT